MMPSAELEASLKKLLDKWVEQNAEETWFTDHTGWLTDDTTAYAAKILALLFESQRDQADYEVSEID